jgi:exopolyphosphatase / guanosine-5'-triphosphate,3'-diphosphate pyrophosphatase
VSGAPRLSAPRPGPGERVAGIDIGTNSIHLVVAERSADGRTEIVHRVRDSARLGAGSHRDGRLAEDAIDRAIAVLASMRATCDRLGVRQPIRAVATSAARDASNTDELVRRARDEARVSIDVIDGATEARLIHLGVLAALGDSTLDLAHRPHVAVDVGGGSTEMIGATGDDRSIVESLQVGAIRLTDLAAPGGVVDHQTATRIDELVDAELARLDHLDQRARAMGEVVPIASSGSASTVVSMTLARRTGRTEATPSADSNGVVVSWDEFEAVVDALLAARTPDERRSIPGLATDRLEIAPAGVLVLRRVLQQCIARPHADGVAFVHSSGALRDGLVAELLGS